MSMWDFPIDKTAAFGEDPARPNEFIWHIPEYDEAGNLVGGDKNYYRHDPPPIGHSGRQGDGIGLNTSIKGGLDQAGPAEMVPNDHARLDSPGSWGPELAGPLDSSGTPLGGTSYYPYPGPEQLAKDTYFTLGRNRAFHWPGGQQAAEDNHNSVINHGFTLENSGTDDEPIPSYRSLHSPHRIEPSGDEDLPWQVSGLNGAPKKFATTGDAAMGFGSALSEERRAAEEEQRRHDLERRQEQYNRPARQFQEGDDASYARGEFGGGSHQNYDIGRSQRYRPSNTSGPRARGGRPTNLNDAMRYAIGHASYLSGDDAPNATWNLRNEGTTYGGHPSVIPSHGTGMLDGYVAQQYDRDRASGRMQHVIYHHATPLAWLNVDPGQDEGGGDRHTWVIPDERYSVTSSKRQSAIRGYVQRLTSANVEEPYDPARGVPNSHLQGDAVNGTVPATYTYRSHNAENLVNRLANNGYARPSHNTRQKAVFVRPSVESTEELPYYTRHHTHGVYLRPVDKPTDIQGRSTPAWVVGEHQDGANKIAGSKRFDNLDDALAHGERIHQWITNGSEGDMPTIPRPRSDSPRQPRQRDENRLPGQRPIPGINQMIRGSSVADWSDFLRG